MNVYIFLIDDFFVRRIASTSSVLVSFFSMICSTEILHISIEFRFIIYTSFLNSFKVVMDSILFVKADSFDNVASGIFVVISKLNLGSIILDFDELNSVILIHEFLVIDLSIDIFISLEIIGANSKLSRVIVVIAV